MTTGNVMGAALAAAALWASAAGAQQHTVPLGDLLPEDRVVSASGLAAGAAQAAGAAVSNAVNAGFLCTVQAAHAIAAGRAGRDELDAAAQGLALAIAPLASTGQVALAVAPALAAIGAHAGNAAIHLTLNQAAKIAAALTAEADPAALPLLAAHTNAAGIHLTPGQAARIAAAVTHEQDLAALAKIAELSANRVTRWHDPQDPLRWAEFDGGTNIIVYAASVAGTNLTVTLSADFLSIDATRPAWTNHAWPFNEDGWTGANYDMSGQPWFLIRNENFDNVEWNGFPPNPIQYPVVLEPLAPATGVATVSSHIAYATNTVARYFIPSHVIPPELENLDLLQAWLNNSYYTKAQSDTNFVTLASKELHADSYTNVIWRDVWSNGWRFAVAYTNTP